ncbi:sensor histidine kinase [Caldimonas sp. KR1-144]|uniref:sensor histidine kinase n=1 Tax=Caldimonas sp. KR1-144 TaxID=3400911 RepID=UPI003C050B20
MTNAAYAQAGAVICGLLGLMFLWMRACHRDPGSGWFAAGFTLVCTIFFFDLRLQPGGTSAHRGASLAGALAVMLLGFGLIDFLAPTLRRPMRWRVALAAPLLLAIGWLPVGPLPRVLAHALVAMSLIVMAMAAACATRREPGAGFRLITVALLLHPACLFAFVVAGVDPYQLRYLLIVPVGVLGATLFAVNLTRSRARLETELAARVAAQRELAELNASLEQQVEQRTAALHEIIEGLESFNRSVSHDLRGPLGGIALATRMAVEAADRGDLAAVRRLLEPVAEQAEALTRLVSDLLALARVDDVRLSLARVDLHASVEEALAQLRLGGAEAHWVRVGALPTVDADPGLVRQLFVNLLGNALKFSRGSQPRPEVEVGLGAHEGQTVVYVRDNGVGFDESHAERLFKPFQRLHGRAFEGHGIGLSIVRRIVERHGGKLWVRAAPGRGATFFFSLGPGSHAR